MDFWSERRRRPEIVKFTIFARQQRRPDLPRLSLKRLALVELIHRQ